MNITQEQLNEIITKHKKWLNVEEGGERAVLKGANLSRADLSHADLRRADLWDADLSHADLRRADLSHADLSHADLRYADLRNADLSNADLRYADLSHADLRHANLADVNMNFSSFPLWCGSLTANFDDRIIIQLIYHAVKAGLNSRNTTDEVKAELRKVINLANRFHRVNECGRIE